MHETLRNCLKPTEIQMYIVLVCIGSICLCDPLRHSIVFIHVCVWMAQPNCSLFGCPQSLVSASSHLWAHCHGPPATGLTESTFAGALRNLSQEMYMNFMNYHQLAMLQNPSNI